MHDFLASIPHLLLVLVVAGLVGAESIGLPLPGETVLITAVLVGQQDGLTPWALFAAAAIGAIVGDNIGYLIGRFAGVPVLDFARTRLPRAFRTETILAAARLMARYGAWAIFAARFVALLRVLSGPLAGTLRYRYRTFFWVNAAGAVTWAGLVTLATALLGREARALMHQLSWVALAVAALVVIIVVVALVIRRRQRAKHPAPALSPEDAARPLGELLAEISAKKGR